MADFSDLEFMQRGRRLLVGVVMLGLGGLIGFALPHSNASPSARTGSVVSVGNATKDAGMQVVFQPDKGKDKGKKETFRLQSATPWQKAPGDKWQTKGTPPCVIAGNTSATAATIGVVNVAGTGNLPGRSVIVWVECYT
jgi:hypothetical protein